MSASRANTVGLLTLRKLAAVAPDPDSDVVFLPQQRAINVMKTCQQWVTSDEDIDEEVESEMTLIFQHFAPLLQNVPGTHWDLVFDVIENNLDVSGFVSILTVTVANKLSIELLPGRQQRACYSCADFALDYSYRGLGIY